MDCATMLKSQVGFPVSEVCRLGSGSRHIIGVITEQAESASAFRFAEALTGVPHTR